jgi:hypothetical protein
MEAALLEILPIYILLLIVLGICMFLTRKKAIKDKRVHWRYFKDYQGEIPEDLRILQNHFNSHFQVPVIFLLVVVAAVSLQTVSALTLVFGYGFLLSRVLHFYYHVIDGNILRRAGSFLVGMILTFAISIEIFCRYSLT